MSKPFLSPLYSALLPDEISQRVPLTGLLNPCLLYSAHNLFQTPLCVAFILIWSLLQQRMLVLWFACVLKYSSQFSEFILCFPSSYWWAQLLKLNETVWGNIMLNPSQFADVLLLFNPEFPFIQIGWTASSRSKVRYRTLGFQSDFLQLYPKCFNLSFSLSSLFAVVVVVELKKDSKMKVKFSYRSSSVTKFARCEYHLLSVPKDRRLWMTICPSSSVVGK